VRLSEDMAVMGLYRGPFATLAAHLPPEFRKLKKAIQGSAAQRGRAHRLSTKFTSGWPRSSIAWAFP